MTKGIYLNRANELLITEYANKEDVSISKAINLLIEKHLSTPPTESKPELTKVESKPPKEEQQTKPKEQKKSPVKEPVMSSAEQRRIEYMNKRMKELSK